MGSKYDVKRFPRCENSYKSKFYKELRPKQCTSNIPPFTNKVSRTDCDAVINDEEFEDALHCDRYVPVKFTPSQQQLELKLQSSLLQILQQETPNARNVPIECTPCKIPHCFYCSRNSSISSNKPLRSVTENVKESLYTPMPPVTQELTRRTDLDHKRDIKWESYMKYVKPRKCDCSKISKKHLYEHLPAYMTKMSPYDAPDLLNYESCPLAILKTLVKNANGPKETIQSSPDVIFSSKEIATQYSNHEILCCSNIHKCFKKSKLNNEVETSWNTNNLYSLVDGSMSRTYLTKDIKTFAKHRAISLRHFIDEAPDVKEIFDAENCAFNY